MYIYTYIQKNSQTTYVYGECIFTHTYRGSQTTYVYGECIFTHTYRRIVRPLTYMVNVYTHTLLTYGYLHMVVFWYRIPKASLHQILVFPLFLCTSRGFPIYHLYSLRNTVLRLSNVYLVCF